MEFVDFQLKNIKNRMYIFLFQKYNIDDIYMHLTNYAINKQSHFFK